MTSWPAGLCSAATLAAMFLAGCGSGDPARAQQRAGALPRRFVDRASGVAVRYPAGWRVDRRALTRLISPRQLLVVSSFPIRQRRPDPNCTPRTAISELPLTGALLFLLEQPHADNRSGAHSAFGKRPVHFHLGGLAAQDRECFGVSRGLDFRSAGRDIYMLAYFGPKANSYTEHLADRVLDSLKLQAREGELAEIADQVSLGACRWRPSSACVPPHLS